jgi:hypothetical protein
MGGIEDERRSRTTGEQAESASQEKMMNWASHDAIERRPQRGLDALRLA